MNLSMIKKGESANITVLYDIEKTTEVAGHGSQNSAVTMRREETLTSSLKRKCDERKE